MDFYIGDLSFDGFKTDKNLIKQWNTKRFATVPAGLKVLSVIEYSEQGSVLGIVTSMEYSVMTAQPQKLASIQCTTMYVINNTRMLTMGENNSSIAFLENLMHLAQAHSYGMLFSECKRQGLAVGTGMQVTPAGKFRLQILELLAKYKQI